MKPIREVYPNDIDDRGRVSCVSSYEPMVESIGVTIEVQVDDRDYQGDSRMVVRDGGRYGILIFGWGSCSGCDSLQACDTAEELERLRDRLASDIKWFDSASECLRYVNEHDWEGDFCWPAEETKEFIGKAQEYLMVALLEATKT